VQPVRTDVAGGNFGGGVESLPHQVAVGVRIHQGADFLQQGNHLRAVAVIHMLLPFKWANAKGRRIIQQLVILEIGVEQIQPEAICAAVQPEAEDIDQFPADLRVAPVQVGLAG